MNIFLLCQTFCAIFFLTAGFSLLAAADKAPSNDLTTSAVASEAWLHQVDEGKYGESWDAGSQIFKATISKDEWNKYLNASRQPLGSVTSRVVVDQRTAENPKGLLPGHYMVMVYKTSFSNKPNTFEIVTLRQEEDGQWRVLTYQAK